MKNNNNKLFVLETRKVTVKGKTSVFTAGDIVTETKMRRLYNGNLPAWVINATDIEALIIRNNHSVDQANQEFDINDATETQKAQIQLVEEHLLNLGFTRNNFSFGLNTTLAFKNADKETVWVGVKMETEADAFIGHNNKRVSLQLNNWISVNTFVSRVEKGGDLFLGDQA